MNMKEEVENYVNYLKKELNSSENTCIGYRRDLDEFGSFLKSKNLNYLCLNRDDIRNYLKFLDDKKLKNSSISRKICSLRSFYNYLVDNKRIVYNIFKSISNPKLEKKLPNFLNYEDMREILDSIDITSDEGIRNKLIIELFYATGCRVGELVQIKLDDINAHDNTIKIMGKGSKERTVYFGDYAKDILFKYLDKVRIKYILDNDMGYLFYNKNGSIMTIYDMEYIVKMIVKDLSLKSHVTPHTFRHTFATHLLNNGADIKTVQELLGHANLNTTGIYTHVSNDRLKEVYLKTFPRK